MWLHKMSRAMPPFGLSVLSVIIFVLTSLRGEFQWKGKPIFYNVLIGKCKKHTFYPAWQDSVVKSIKALQKLTFFQQKMVASLDIVCLKI